MYNCLALFSNYLTTIKKAALHGGVSGVRQWDRMATITKESLVIRVHALNVSSCVYSSV